MSKLLTAIALAVVMSFGAANTAEAGCGGGGFYGGYGNQFSGYRGANVYRQSYGNINRGFNVNIGYGGYSGYGSYGGFNNSIYARPTNYGFNNVGYRGGRSCGYRGW